MPHGWMVRTGFIEEGEAGRKEEGNVAWPACRCGGVCLEQGKLGGRECVRDGKGRGLLFAQEVCVLVEEHWEHRFLRRPKVAHNLDRGNVKDVIDRVDHPWVKGDDLHGEGVH